MAVDLSRWPLLALMENINRWERSARSDDFWRTLTEHIHWANSLRDEAKGIIVWLELNRLEETASRLDEAMRCFREALWEFEHVCEGTYSPDDPRCRERREAFIETAARVAGVAEALDGEVAERVWEGYGHA